MAILSLFLSSVLIYPFWERKKQPHAKANVVIDTVHPQKTVETRRTIAYAPKCPVPNQLAEHAEFPIRQVPQFRIALDGPFSPQHAELPLQAVRTPRSPWPP